MKKAAFLMAAVFIPAAVSAQDIPIQEEAARVIEGYWHCIGNGDINAIGEYAAQEYVDFAVLLMGELDEAQKRALRSYKVFMISIETDGSGHYYCVYTDNNVFYVEGEGPSYLTLIRSGSKLLIGH